MLWPRQAPMPGSICVNALAIGQPPVQGGVHSASGTGGNSPGRSPGAHGCPDRPLELCGVIPCKAVPVRGGRGRGFTGRYAAARAGARVILSTCLLTSTSPGLLPRPAACCSQQRPHILKVLAGSGAPGAQDHHRDCPSRQSISGIQERKSRWRASHNFVCA